MSENQPPSPGSRVASIMISLDPKGRVAVRRDMELVRRILVAIESRQSLTPEPIRIEGEDEVVVLRHIEMLHHAGMIDGIVHKIGSRSGPPDIMVIDLSWDGHDFVAALRNETVWAKMKAGLSPSDLATVPLGLLKEAGVGLLRQVLFSAIGLPT